jgi:hypothetical protein
VVEHHLRKSFSSEDHNFEERYMLAQFLFLKGDVEGSVVLFDLIHRRAPKLFARDGQCWPGSVPHWGAVDPIAMIHRIAVQDSAHPRGRSIFLRTRVLPRCRSSAAAILAHEQRSSPFRSSALCRKCWRGQSPDILAVRLAQQLRIFWDKLTKPFIVLLRIIWH